MAVVKGRSTKRRGGEGVFAKVRKALSPKPEPPQRDPDEAAHLVNQGYLQASEGNFEDAIGIYEHALELDQENVPAHFYLGEALCELDDMDQAIEHWQKTIKWSPGSVMARMARGRLKEVRGWTNTRAALEELTAEPTPDAMSGVVEELLCNAGWMLVNGARAAFVGDQLTEAIRQAPQLADDFLAVLQKHGAAGDERMLKNIEFMLTMVKDEAVQRTLIHELCENRRKELDVWGSIVGKGINAFAAVLIALILKRPV